MLFYFLACDCCYLTSCLVYIIRRNTSVDESYEWDSADACVDSEVLEATRFDQSQSNRGDPGRDQPVGLRDQRQKGDTFISAVFDVACASCESHACTSSSCARTLWLLWACPMNCPYMSFLSPMPFPGPPPSVSPPRCQYSRSLSEARFNALRQEYQEYRRAQESACSHVPSLTPGHDSDSDSNSALF